MKKIIYIVLALIVIIGAAFYFNPNIKSKLNPLSDWRTYSNQKYGFGFQYPSELFLSAFNGTTTPDQLYDVAFLSSKKGASYRDNNFFVVSYSPSVQNTFDAFPIPDSMPNSKPITTLGDYVSYYKGHMEDYKNFPKGASWSEEDINGLHYYKMTAIGLQSYLLEKQGVYVLTFSTSTPQYVQFEKDIPEIMSSFKFKI